MAFFSCDSRLLKGGEGEVELSRWDEDGGVLEDFVEDWVTSVSVALAICSAIWCLTKKNVEKYKTILKY